MEIGGGAGTGEGGDIGGGDGARYDECEGEGHEDDMEPSTGSE